MKNQKSWHVYFTNATRLRLCLTPFAATNVYVAPYSSGNLFITSIQPYFDALKSKAGLYELAVDAAQNAGDDVLLADTDLDNAVRNVFDDCKKYDRTHTGGEVLFKIFKDGTFSEIVRMPYKDEPNEVEQIAVKIESLGASHQLYQLGALLRGAVAKVRTGIEAHKTAIRESGTAVAELEIAKADAVRAYEANYLDARKALGKANAERLFPALAATNNSDTGTETNPEATDPTA